MRNENETVKTVASSIPLFLNACEYLDLQQTHGVLLYLVSS